MTATQPTPPDNSKQLKIGLAVGAGVVLIVIAVIAVLASLLNNKPSDAMATTLPTVQATASPEPSAAASEDAAAQPQPSAGPFTGTAPKNSEGSGIVIGPASAKVKVEVFYDYMCPYCGLLEKANGEALLAMSNAGQINLIYHPMSFLDKASNGAQYSTRAANAFATAANADVASAAKFSQGLFENQPAEGTEGLNDEKIAELAKAAGVADDVVASFTSATFAPWVGWATQADFQAGIEGTPTVWIDGEKFSGNPIQGTELIDAIKAKLA